MSTEDKNIEKQNFQIVNFEKVKEVNFCERIKTSSDWVLWGEDNLYPLHIQNLLDASSIHKAIVESKVNYIIGDGFKKDFQANPDETMIEVFRKCIYDYVIFGGYVLNVVKTRGGGYLYYHIPVQKVRSGKKNMQQKVETYYYSNDWAKYRTVDFAPIAIPAYSSDSKEPNQIMFFKNYAVNAEYYPVPSYSSGLRYINIDGEIAKFWENSIANGMNPSMSVTFVGADMTNEEKRKVKRKVEDTYTGTENAGRIIVNFVESADQKPLIDTIAPPQLDKQFTVLKTLVTDNIVYAHQLTSPLLAGIKTPGQLGATNELITSYSIYNQNVIEPSRKNCLDALIKTTENKKLEIVARDPISFSFTENMMAQIMTKDELRAQIGLEPIVLIETPSTPEDPTNLPTV